jgi:hypothetical protein
LSAGSGERVYPFQLGETREVGIGGKQLAAMFNGKGCKMCVCYQIGNSLPINELLFENRPVALGRPDDSCTGLIQPALNPRKRLFQMERMLEDPWIRPYPDKGGENRPAKANGFRSGQLFIQPCTRLPVTGVKRVFRVQQNVGIDEDQR